MNRLGRLTERDWFIGLAGFALVLSLTGFVLQYGFKVIPCEMCWWQRFAHYGIFALAVMGVGLADGRLRRGFWLGIGLVALGGLGVACWQFAAQHGWLPFPAACTSANAQALVGGADLLSAMQTTQIVPCDKETFLLLGLSLAGWNIPAMVVVLGVALRVFGGRVFRR